VQAGLAEGGGLLVADEGADGQGGAEQVGFRVAMVAAAGVNFWQQFTRDVEQLQEFVVPVAAVQVVEQGAGGVAGVGSVLAPVGEFPQQPAVDGAKGQLAPSCAGTGIGQVVEQSFQLAAGEVGIE
jgi:hypothetical protein